MSSYTETIAWVLQEILAENQAKEALITADPTAAAKEIIGVMSLMAPMMIVFSGNDNDALKAYMNSVLALMLDDFKKAVVEETIKSGAQDQLDEILGRKK